MTQAALQRRNLLLSLLEQVQDQQLIEELLSMVKANFEKKVYVTSDLEKAAILEAQQEVAEGKWISADDAELAMEEWLADYSIHQNQVRS